MRKYEPLLFVVGLIAVFIYYIYENLKTDLIPLRFYTYKIIVLRCSQVELQIEEFLWFKYTGWHLLRYMRACVNNVKKGKRVNNRVEI